MVEIFKDIPNYEGIYQVSNKGNVKSLTRTIQSKSSIVRTTHPRVIQGRILKNNLNTQGYPIVRLCNQGVSKVFLVHILMAITFLDYKPTTRRIVIDHKDNVPTNNTLDNLQIISNRKNCSKDKKGYSSKYVGVSFFKITGKWVASISINNKVYNLGYYLKEIDAHHAYQNKLKEVE